MKINKTRKKINILQMVTVCVGLSLAAGGPVEAQTVGYGEAIGAVTAACGADIEKQCKGVKPGGGAISACLAKNSSRISSKCAETFEAAFGLLVKRAAAQDAAAGLCQADAERLCSNYREGRARILRCLTRIDNRRKVSNKCNQAITDAGWR